MVFLSLMNASKAFICLLLVNSSVFASEPTSSFSFSEKKGLQPLTPSIKQEKGKEPQTVGNKIDQSAKEGKKEGAQRENSLIESSSEKTELQDQSVSSLIESRSEKTELQDQSASSLIESSSEKTELQDQSVSSLIESSPEEADLETPENSISEDFAPKAEEVEGTDFLDSLLEDTSWFFQVKKTKHKLGIIPFLHYDTTHSFRLDLRFFSYSSDKKGYYFGFSGSKYLFRPFSRFNISYIGDRKENLRSESSFIYDNHYENHFGQGMLAKYSDLKELYAHRFIVNYKIFYQVPKQNFYFGLGTQIFFRKERPEYQSGKKYFDNELFLFLKGLAVYDSRDNWKEPKTGVFHQLSFGCKPILAYQGSYCKGEGDLRFYISLFKEMDIHQSFKKSVLALRAFAGSSFLSPSSYSLTYSLGGQDIFQNLNSLRGFEQNRFRGDKIYFAQAEIRVPVWKKYIDGVLFTELGEAAKYKESFSGFVVDYGGGFRIGFPPDYDMKLRFDFGTGKDKQKKRNYNSIVTFFHAF